MSRYGKIESGFWHNPKVRGLSEPARYLLLYLFSCPHGNVAGCFVLPEGYIASDLGWGQETVSETLSELFEKRLLERDETTMLTRICGWWGHNTIDNPNVAKFVAKEILALPKCEIRQHVIDDLLARTDLNEKVFETLSKLLGQPYRNQEHNITIQEHNNTKRAPREVRDKKEFEEWYQAYPRHEARGKAEKAYWVARKKADHPTLLSAATRARQQYASTEPKYIPLPATWLNAERWLDEKASSSWSIDETCPPEIYRGVQ